MVGTGSGGMKPCRKQRAAATAATALLMIVIVASPVSAQPEVPGTEPGPSAGTPPGDTVDDVVVDIATAAELQSALQDGRRHIRVVEHLDATSTPPQRAVVDQSEAVMFEAASVTRTIRGECWTAPPATLKVSGDWKPGMCLVHVRDHTAFSFRKHEGVAWVHNLYVLQTGTQSPRTRRTGFEYETVAQMSYLYWTDMSLELRPDEQVKNGSAFAVATATAMSGHLEIMLAGVSIVTWGASSAPALLEASAGSVAVEHSRIVAHKTQQPGLLTFRSDLRIENTTFVTKGDAADLAFHSELGTRYVYTDGRVAVVSIGPDPAEPMMLPLWEANGDARLRNGQAPFLQPRDGVFGTLRAEVPSPATPSPPAPDAPPSEVPPSPSFPIAAIIGSVASLGAVLLIACAYCVWRRRKVQHSLVASESSDASKADAVAVGTELPASSSTATRADYCVLRFTPPQTDEDPWHAANASHDRVAGASTALQVSDAACRATLPSRGQSGSRPRLPGSRSPTNSTALTIDGGFSGNVALPANSGPVVPRPQRAAKNPALQLLEDTLEQLRVSDLKLAGRWTVLSSKQRRVGGQGLVQWVRDEREQADHVVKFFFGGGSAFRREAELYGRDEVREMMAAVVHLQPAGMPCPTSGGRLPPWIVLERGSSLSDWAAIQKPDVLTSAQVLSQILMRLERLHNLGLVHRDIKPANILWRDAAKAWTLIDFGCVVDTRSEDDATLSFSLPYAAPEVIHALERGDRTMHIDASLDIWSIGLVTYELLVEERVFGPGTTEEDIMDRLAGRVPLPWEDDCSTSARQAQLSKLGMLQGPVLACMSRSPGERPSAEQLLDSLHRIFSSINETDLSDSDAAD